MIVGLGIDVASVERIRLAIQRFGERFLRRILTAPEREEIAGRRDEAQAIAARFAAKEATFKALGGPHDVSWRHIALLRGETGPPRIELSGTAAQHARRLSVSTTLVSVTHDAGVAVAVVVLQRGE